MSLSQVLSTSMSGLRAAQTGMSLVASNVANAQTPGYIKKSVVQSTTGAGGTGAGVRVEAINRELDVYIQRQLRTETAGGAYAETRAHVLPATPAGSTACPDRPASLESVYNSSNSRLQGAGDQSRFGCRPKHRHRRRPGSGAAAQRHDARHPAPARRCGAHAVRRGADAPTTRCSRSRDQSAARHDGRQGCRLGARCSTSATPISTSFRG